MAAASVTVWKGNKRPINPLKNPRVFRLGALHSAWPQFASFIHTEMVLSLALLPGVHFSAGCCCQPPGSSCQGHFHWMCLLLAPCLGNWRSAAYQGLVTSAAMDFFWDLLPIFSCYLSPSFLLSQSWLFLTSTSPPALNLTLLLCFSTMQYCYSECLNICGSAFDFTLLSHGIFHPLVFNFEV